jgi:hypothetical protein
MVEFDLINKTKKVNRMWTGTYPLPVCRRHQEMDSQKSKMVPVKILGDHYFSEFMRDVKIEEVLGRPFTFVYVSSVSSLALELDSLGVENVTILCCMTTIFDEFVSTESGTPKPGSFDRMRIIVDSYLSKPHDLYYVPPLGRSPDKVSRQFQDSFTEFTVC